MRMGMRAAAGLAALVLAVSAALAEGERAGDFDHYVLALSWSPSWCATTGATRGDPQCAPGRAARFVLHGLWPQYGDGGWPSFCHSPAPDPSRAQTAAMADIMGNPGAAWYQWKKHGRCAGLAAADYFSLARRALAGVTIPPVLQEIDHDVRLPASVIEAAFLEVNPAFRPDMVTITCKGERIAEVRLCLTRDLAPRPCAGPAARDCRAQSALLAAPR
ncbi:ribonuclease T2 family protein [Phaeovulum vinaykumarii]|uniref:Ribonuclease T2 n=1 Tax=Phaeovulum vinaykumarii TaxID=407234 RepID=A0A1N7MMI2_9RHOB|nr:ribonuclease T2 [Phaeovulum vinaykumarii]SIS87346.1 ribonuclease T2 [Phaeovulum vinaykumarii]SOC13192.1 ribonuclease T2 [Phaeovulum vinaykumarii]